MQPPFQRQHRLDLDPERDLCPDRDIIPITAPGLAIQEYVSLEEAEQGLREATARYLEGRESATDDLEKYSRMVEAHPESVAKKEVEKVKWAEEQGPVCEQAWREMAGFIPVEQMTKEQMISHGLSPALAGRIWKTPPLRLIRMHPDDIESIHVADLKHKYAVYGLDIVEMRAIFHAIPASIGLRNAEKQLWREGIQNQVLTHTLLSNPSLCGKLVFF